MPLILNVHIDPVFICFECAHITVDTNELLWDSDKSRHPLTLLPILLMSNNDAGLFNSVWHLFSFFYIYIFFFHRFVIKNNNWTELREEWSLHPYSRFLALSEHFSMHSFKLLCKSKLNCVIPFMGKKNPCKNGVNNVCVQRTVR